ncbi:hypothetical protein [Archaeoglobus profundus]|uniref:Uncharacterized protein n=1 Tax=Archaeoglobus profundus (strain DSM 5631 / JCM 9629 / NBRC 100127 / Av18) TaxID=572546 RepID=D2RFX1_ARCPA|nr:hypothetical protein [Archaeoglobus profundus]ADB57196.1 hypothetical protein Arcpr_0124 [Archaeoglobus profundus DSM 5631]
MSTPTAKGGNLKKKSVIDFKSFSEKCPFMIRDQRNIKNCIFNEDFPTDCKQEVCKLIGGGDAFVPYVP